MKLNRSHSWLSVSNETSNSDFGAMNFFLFWLCQHDKNLRGEVSVTKIETQDVIYVYFISQRITLVDNLSCLWVCINIMKTCDPKLSDLNGTWRTDLCGFHTSESEGDRLSIGSFDSISSRKKCVTIGLLQYMSLFTVALYQYDGNLEVSVTMMKT